MVLRESIEALRRVLVVGLVLVAAWAGEIADGNPGRNQMAVVTGLPAVMDPGTWRSSREGYDTSTSTNLRWSLPLGSMTYGSPVVADGKVYIGFRPSGSQGSALRCVDAATGVVDWELKTSWALARGHGRLRLADGRSLEYALTSYGYCGSPLVTGDRLYVVNPLADVLCLDVRGQADGNAGPFTMEGTYNAPPRSVTIREDAAAALLDGRLVPGMKLVDVRWSDPDPVLPTDGDIVWRYGLTNQQAIMFEDAAGGTPLIHGDLVYVVVPSGMKAGMHLSPELPLLVALDRHTGDLVARDRVGIGPRVAHGTWSSPSLGMVAGRPLVFVGGPDGTCYAFTAEPVPGKDGAPGLLAEVWRHDCNAPGHRTFTFDDLGRLQRDDHHGEIIATPVFHSGRVYVAIGRDPGHDGIGPGRLVCIDATKTGDITDSGTVWTYEDLNRSVSTVSIADGRLFLADILGVVHCLDLATGAPLWTQATADPPARANQADDRGCWGSTLVADGKVYVGNGAGLLTVLRAGPVAEVLLRVDLHSPIHCTPAAAGPILYVATHQSLFAFGLTGE